MAKLSVIVCTFNRSSYILKTLGYLNDQSAEPGDYEVLVIDNNSTDNTGTVCQNFISENSLSNFHYFLETRQGHTYARNRGITESKGTYISFLDDDAWVNRNYCKELITYFESNPGVMALGGKITPVYESVAPGWMSKYLWPLVAGLDMGDKERAFKYSKYPIGANMAFKAEVFEDYGYFNTELGRRGKELEGGDEKDMVYRLKKDRKKVVYVPAIHVRHIIPDARLRISYIKGQAVGVGTSEKKRLINDGFYVKLTKIVEELIKTGATCVLAIYYIFTFRPSKGIMLIKFRYWVVQGYMQRIT
jgi:glycosyltransferase involved in cell wall biosynthesis